VIEENKSLRSRNCFLETHYVYNEQVPPEHEASLQEFLINGMKRSKIASLIYHVDKTSEIVLVTPILKTGVIHCNLLV
jgi:hypothetical protein